LFSIRNFPFDRLLLCGVGGGNFKQGHTITCHSIPKARYAEGGCSLVLDMQCHSPDERSHSCDTQLQLMGQLRFQPPLQILHIADPFFDAIWGSIGIQVMLQRTGSRSSMRVRLVSSDSSAHGHGQDHELPSLMFLEGGKTGAERCRVVPSDGSRIGLCKLPFCAPAYARSYWAWGLHICVSLIPCSCKGRGSSTEAQQTSPKLED
jgi:hypothetical protein